MIAVESEPETTAPAAPTPPERARLIRAIDAYLASLAERDRIDREAARILADLESAMGRKLDIREHALFEDWGAHGGDLAEAGRDALARAIRGTRDDAYRGVRYRGRIFLALDESGNSFDPIRTVEPGQFLDLDQIGGPTHPERPESVG